MGLSSIISKLKEEKSVFNAFLLESDFYEEVIAEESSVTESSMGMQMVNKALEEVLKRDTALCVFCYSSFDIPTEHVLTMEDEEGNLVGHDVPICMTDCYKDEPGIFWLCEDFVMYPERASGDVHVVMLPQRAKIIGESDGARDPVILYPATTTDIMLKKHFDSTVNDSSIATAILAFDLIR